MIFEISCTDMAVFAKGIANGYPMGGFIVRRKFADVLTAGTHASTFGGTPLACAAALAVQECFDKDGVLENCRSVGAFLKSELEKVIAPYGFAKCVRGRGLMLGVVLDRPAGPLQELVLKKRVVALTAGETVLRLLPPLVITREQAATAVAAIAEALKEFAASIGEK